MSESCGHHNIPDNSIVLEFEAKKGVLPQPLRMKWMRESGWSGGSNVQLSVHDHDDSTHYTYLFLPSGTERIAKKFAAKVKSKGVRVRATQYRNGKERPYML